MQSMVAAWRGQWNEGEFPFLYVQLAPHGKYRSRPQALPEMWEQQTAALTMIPNSGMAPTGDIGDVDNIHPTNKHDVGHRLALIALAKTYQRPGIIYQPPMYKSYAIEGNAVRIRFTGVGAGLTTRDGNPPALFEIAGADGVFHPADAKIEGSEVVLTSQAVAKPTQARFAWSPNAAPDLINKDGLPAIAFRTK
jgi:sialate O-acetylesterase